MNIFNSPEQISQLGFHTGLKSQPFIATIGNFDGVHLGHQKLIKEMKEIAQSHNWRVLVITFSPHPRQILNPYTPLESLTEDSEKFALMKEFGVSDCLVEKFTKEFSQQPYEQYLQKLLDHLNIQYFLMGHDFMFGANRAGSFQKLQDYCLKRSIKCKQILPLQTNGITISSSQIRKLIHQGSVNEVKTYLGRNFHLSGVVIKGAGRGKILGFPTANIRLSGQILPSKGVYVVRVKLEEKAYNGLTNVGDQPTFADQGNTTKQLVETHLLDFNQDIYGAKIEIDFLEFIRPEQKFDGKESLIAQINQDLLSARNWFNKKL